MVKAAELHQSKSRLAIVSSGTHSSIKLEKVISAPNLLQAMNDKEYCTPENGMATRYPDTKGMCPIYNYLKIYRNTKCASIQRILHAGSR